MDNKQKFRQAMSNLCSAVNIVTTNGVAGKCGLTATAVCSVSDEPPTVLVCINRGSEMNGVFKANQVLAVNTLRSEQVEVARHFAGMTSLNMEQRFMCDGWGDSAKLNQPILSDSINQLVGKITNVYEQGTHSIFIVELEEIKPTKSEDNPKGLVYFNRQFSAVV